jgi:isopenicillin N synthase-like dioxygenase
MVEFTEQLLTVEVVLKQIFTAALSSAKGIELPTTYLKDVEEDTTGQLRVSRYTNTPGFEDAIKLLPHSDWGTLTIINSADEGLEEVRDGRWYKVPAKKGELHVNVGEMYAMWSNGLFKNNIHRVSSEAAMDRTSFGYFTSQGTLTSNAGINPICSAGEESKFPRASTKSHVMHYMNKLTGRQFEH